MLGGVWAVSGHGEDRERGGVGGWERGENRGGSPPSSPLHHQQALIFYFLQSHVTIVTNSRWWWESVWGGGSTIWNRKASWPEGGLDLFCCCCFLPDPSLLAWGWPLRNMKRAFVVWLRRQSRAGRMTDWMDYAFVLVLLLCFSLFLCLQNSHGYWVTSEEQWYREVEYLTKYRDSVHCSR